MGACITKQEVPQTDLTSSQDRPFDNKLTKMQSLSSQPEVENWVYLQLRRGEKKRVAKIEVIEEQIYENIHKKEQQKTPFDYQMILNAFSNHFLFAQLQNQDKEKLIHEMYYCTAKDDEMLFQQGDKASLFFVIERGACQIIINGEIKRVLKSPEFFGELALMYSAPRSASVKTRGDCGFWVLERSKFRKAVEDIQILAYEQNRIFLDQVKFFDFLTVDQRDNIANVLITLVFKQGELIVAEGDMANSFYIIKKGEVQVTKQGAFLRYMHAGDSFGEQALFGNCVRGATVKASQDNVEILSLSREDITAILGDKIQLIIYTNMQKWAFEKHPQLRDLTKMQIQKIVSNFEYKTYEQNTILFHKDQLINKLIIILDGQISIDGQSVLNNGQLFGEAFLSIEESRRKIGHDIRTTRKTTLSELGFAKFFNCIGGELEAVMKKNKDRAGSNSIYEQQQRGDYSYLHLDEFICLDKLGTGQFGSVYLVRQMQSQNKHAIKCIPKMQVIQSQTEKYVQSEKVVMELLNYNLIVQFHRTFRDQHYIYFLMEYVRGKELFDVIREIGLLNTFETQFYIAQLILCLEKLHSHNIVYRDLKPENVIVTENGYIKLIDMGTAKILKSKVSKTFTLIGTPHYMSPEMLVGKGYTYSTDIWSLGVCFYEFMCGEVPFAEEEEDPYNIQDAILNNSLKYPSFLKDSKAIKLMDQLLNKTPELRLGGSYDALKVHSWFDQFDWEGLECFEAKAPYIPKLKQKQYHEELFTNVIAQDTPQDLLCTQHVQWDNEF